MDNNDVKITTWNNCYDASWKGVITAKSFSHPAKFARGLIERIYIHCLERGYVRKGDTVGDFFGGIGTGGIMAAYNGLRWFGVELEPRFIEWAQDNFALHRHRWAGIQCPQPVIVQGDSRKFAEIIAGMVDSVVTSPAYADSTRGNNTCGVDWDKAAPTKKTSGRHQAPGKSVSEDYGKSPGQIGRLRAGTVDGVVGSPPFTQTPGGAKGINVNGYNGRSDIKPDFLGSRTYQGRGGDRVDGNIETLRPGTVDAAISSPPYSGISAGAGGLNTKPAKHAGQQSGRSAKAASQDTDQKYGRTEGQISRLSGGSVDACVSSPPYSETLHHGGGPDTERDKLRGGGSLMALKKGYPESPGQIGALKPGKVDACVTSPPWENNSEGGIKASKFNYTLNTNKGHSATPEAKARQMARDEKKVYGDSPGQIGKEKGETYWQAMDAVYRSGFIAIKPGGVMVLVLKDYVKAKKRVLLCDDTCRLLEHIGFVVIERIHAMLVKEQTEAGLDGTDIVTSKSRKSFFRRMAEQKGSPKIDYEEVIVCRRP